MTITLIGSGVNALTAAFYLARAGFKPLVLERRGIVGGAAVTEETSRPDTGRRSRTPRGRCVSRWSATWGSHGASSSAIRIRV